MKSKRFPYKSNFFDVCICFDVLEHVPDINYFLREVKRVLKKNGYLIFDTEDRSFSRRIVSKIYKVSFNPTGFKIYQYSLPRIKNILEKEGFKIDGVRFLKHRVGQQIILRCALVEKI